MFGGRIGDVAIVERREDQDLASSRVSGLQGARAVGPVMLTVDAAAMHAAGHAFYQAANGVWLTDHVPSGNLSGWPGSSR